MLMTTYKKKDFCHSRIKRIILQINQLTMLILERLNLNLPTKIKTKAIIIKQSNILKMRLLFKANL